MSRKTILLTVFLISGYTSCLSQDFKWVKAYETSGYWSGIGVITVDHTGNVYHCGGFIGEMIIGGQTLTTPDNNFDGFLIKYDKDGNFVWRKHLTGVSNQHIFDVAVTADNQLLITGFFQQKFSLDGHTLTTSSGDFGDTYIAKLDIDGNVLSAKNIGIRQTNMADLGGKIAIDKNGNVFVSGGEGQRMYVTKLSPSLNNIWRRTYGFTNQVGTINADNLILDSSGDLYVEGSSNTSGYLLKYNAAGTLLWDQAFNGSIKDMDLDKSGNLIVGVHLLNTTLGGVYFGGDPPFGDGGVIGKMNSAGQFIWYNQTSGFHPGDISVNEWDNNIYFTSLITSDVTLGKINLAVENGSDGLLGVMDPNGRYKWVAKVGFVDSQLGDILYTDAEGFVYIGNRLPKDQEGLFQCETLTGKSQQDLYVAKIQPFTSVPVDGPLELCEGETGLFSFTPVSDFIDYHWDLDPAIQWEVVDSETIKVTAPGPGVYEISITTPADLGCSDFLVYHSTVLHVNDVLEKGSITGPSDVCQGAIGITYIVGTIENAQHSWIPPENTTVDFQSSDNLVLNFADDFTGGELRYRVAGSCNSVEYDPIIITPLYAPAIPANIEGETILCDGVSREYTIAQTENATSYQWFMQVNGGPVENVGDGLTLSQSFAENINNVTVFVRVSNDCGSSESEPFNIDIMHKPEAPDELGGPDAQCPGSEIVLSVTTPNAENYHWKITDGFGVLVLDAINSSATMTYPFTTPLSFEVRSMNECGESEPVAHQVSALGDQFDMPEIDKNCLQLSHQSSQTLSWYLEGTFIGIENLIGIKTPGVYELRYAGVCANISAFREVTREEMIDFIPNVFTPNGDDKNQYFQLSENIEGAQLNVYNRWGRLLFTSEAYSNNWDGGDLPSGQYYYVLTSRCSGEVFKGVLSLIR
jgi:gliding motility-associated-like protein